MSGRSESMAGWMECLARDGYAILPEVVSPTDLAGLVEATASYSEGEHDGRLDRRGEVYGGRDLLWRLPEAAELARSPELVAIAGAAIGPGAFAVRGLFFDKTPTVNWNLPWHQDLTIAVRERRDVSGFGPWTRKGGIPHAHAPAELLARMVTIRLHLDHCGPDGAPCASSQVHTDRDGSTRPRSPPGPRAPATWPSTRSSRPAVRLSCILCCCMPRPRGPDPAAAA